MTKKIALVNNGLPIEIRRSDIKRLSLVVVRFDDTGMTPVIIYDAEERRSTYMGLLTYEGITANDRGVRVQFDSDQIVAHLGDINELPISVISAYNVWCTDNMLLCRGARQSKTA